MLDLIYRIPLATRDRALKTLSIHEKSDDTTRKFVANTYESLKSPLSGTEITKTKAAELLKRLADAQTRTRAEVSAQPEQTSLTKDLPQEEVLSRVKSALSKLDFDRPLRKLPDPQEPNGAQGRSMVIIGVEEDLDQDSLRSKLNSLAAIESLRIWRTAGLGFVCFSKAKDAQTAADSLLESRGVLKVNGNALRLTWGELVDVGPPAVQRKIGLVVRRYMRSGKNPN